MKHAGLLLACLAIMPLGAQAGELYRWLDKQGIVHYGDVPPADARDVERLKLSSQVPQNDDLPYETLRAQQTFPVTLYVGRGCGETCNQARSLLTTRGVPFTEKVLKTKEDVEAFKQLTGADGVPVLSVGKTYLRGFLTEQWHSELDIAGYPKTASYRQRVAPPPKPPAPETLPVEGQAAPSEQSPAASAPVEPSTQ